MEWISVGDIEMNLWSTIPEDPLNQISNLPRVQWIPNPLSHASENDPVTAQNCKTAQNVFVYTVYPSSFRVSEFLSWSFSASRDARTLSRIAMQLHGPQTAEGSTKRECFMD